MVEPIPHHLQSDLARFRSELHGVGEQIDQNLLDPALISDQDRDRFIDSEGDSDLLLVSGILDHAQ